MIREILTIGDSRLLQISQPVKNGEFDTQELNHLIQDMRDTMLDKCGVGISAVQIGCHKRIALIEYDGNNPRYSDIGDCPLTVIINPKVEMVGEQVIEYTEGCLSVPNLRGCVLRPQHIRYKFYNQYGQLIEGESNGFFARVMQHEIDHMNGILFTSRVINPVDSALVENK